VTGNVKPPTLNAELFVLAAVTVTSAPLALRLPDPDPLFPTATLPKARVAGLTPSCPTDPDVDVPVPESETYTGGTVSLEIVIVAVKLPAALGENSMLTLELWLAARFMGRLGEVSAKYLLEIETPVTLMAFEPEFDAVRVRVLLLPAATLPNCRDKLFSDRPEDCCWLEELPPLLTPWQPVRRASPATDSNREINFAARVEPILHAAVLSAFREGTVYLVPACWNGGRLIANKCRRHTATVIDT
jgi:hypothetical protein